MSETPNSQQSVPSPQKRNLTETESNDAKRPKLSNESSSIGADGFDINDLELPKTQGTPQPASQQTGETSSSPPLKIDIPLVPTTSSTQPQSALPSGLPSASASALNTPGQFNLELPELPGDSPNTTNTTINRPSQPSSQPPPSQPQSTVATPGPITGSGPALPTGIAANNTAAAIPKQLGDNDDTEITKPTAPADPDKLSDALLSAGVDLKAEEALLSSTTVQNNQELSNIPQQPIIINTPFLDPRQVSAFMSKVANANGIKQNFDNESLITELMTSACEDWMKNIITNAVIISRHRRRSIKQRKRSELSKALRELAVNSKNLEDKRIQKRKNLGIDQDEQSKLGTEETQHKATNATVAMMTGKKKKYSWMTGGANAGGAPKTSQSTADGGIRFREAREEPGIAVRDLLSSLEKKRIGVEKVLTKGYSKLKD